MKKIMIISTTSDLGGGPIHIRSLIDNLSESYQFYLAAPKDGEISPDLKQKCVGSVDITANKFDFSSAVNLVFFTVKNKIKIVHSHGKGGGVYARFIKIFLPYINIIHTFHGIHFERYGKFKKIIYKFYEALTLALNKKLIFVSISEQSKLVSFLGKDPSRSCVIANGTRVRLSPCEIISKVGKNLGCLRVTFIGRLDPIKNVLAVCELAKCLDAYGIAFQITIVGDGCQRELLLSTIKELELRSVNKITSVGARKDVHAILDETDVLFNASLSEGHPLSLLEAMSAGVICLASNVTGNIDIIDHNRDGLLYPVNDISKAAAMLRALQNDSQTADRLILNGWLKHQHFFSDEKCFERLKAEYEVL